MTTWTSIAAHCKKLFGFAPSPLQMRLWWFGWRYGNSAGELKHRRNWAEREVAPWDVVIKLALSYASKNLAEIKAKPSPEEIGRFVYWLLWKSEQKRTTEAQDKKGMPFLGQTFWGWAVENKNRYTPVVSERGMKSMKQSMKRMMQQFEEE